MMYVELELGIFGRKVEESKNLVVYTGPEGQARSESFVVKSHFVLRAYPYSSLGQPIPTEFKNETDAAETARAGVRAYREAGYDAKGFVVRRYEVDV